MSVSDICRTCGEETSSSYATHLYKDANKLMLHQIETLTGLWLSFKNDMPVYVCSYCSLDIKQAIRFRERCIKMQLKFQIQCKNFNIDMHAPSDSNEKLTKSQQDPLKFISNENNLKQNEEASEIENEIHSDLQLEMNIDFKEINDGEKNFVRSIFNSNSTKPDNSLPGREVLPKSNNLPDYKYKPLYKKTQVHKNFIANRQGESISDNDKTTQSRNRDSKKKLCEQITESDTRLTECIEIKQQNISHTDITTTINEEKSKNAELKQKNEKAKYICELCGKPYSKSDLFEAHVNRHKGENPYACEKCPEKFNAIRSLRRHMLKHTGILPYPCRHCDRRFLDHSLRMLHERMHNNIRPFKCTICEKSFTANSKLRIHLVLHSGERAHRCEVCNRAFSHYKNLVTHFKSAVHKQNEETAKTITTATQADDFN